MMSKVEQMLIEGRTIIPVVDYTGKVCGVLGRNINSPIKNKATAKGFIGNIRTRKKTIILTDDFISPLISQLLDSDNVLAITYLFIPDEVIDFFKNKKKNVILFFEQTDFGRKQADKLAARMNAAGINVYIFKTDNAKDMPQYLLQGNTIESVLQIAK